MSHKCNNLAASQQDCGAHLPLNQQLNDYACVLWGAGIKHKMMKDSELVGRSAAMSGAMARDGWLADWQADATGGREKG